MMNYQTFQNPKNPFGNAPQLPPVAPGLNYVSPGSMQGQEAYEQVMPGMNAQLAYNESILGNEFARKLQQNQQQSVLAGLQDVAAAKQQDQSVQNKALGNQMQFLNTLIRPMFGGGLMGGGELLRSPPLTGKPF